MCTKKHKKAVILLGAGFAKSYGGPSSSEILGCMKTHSDNFVKDIIKELEEYYGENNFSFETVFAVVESLLMYYFSKQLKSGRDANNHTFMPVCYSVQKKIESHCHFLFNSDNMAYRFLFQLFYCMINRLLSFIFQYDNDDYINAHESQYDNLKDFVKTLRDKGYDLKFYSLNYDRLIPRLFGKDVEESLAEAIPENQIEDNLFEDQEAAKRQFDSNEIEEINSKLLPSKLIGFKYNLQEFCSRPFTHFNLHGSRYLRVFNNELVFQNDCWGFFQSGYPIAEGGNPGESLHLSPIIVGQSKSQRSFTQPFKFGFDAFSWDCSTCDAFFSFGYSFKDPHINTILRTYIDDYITPIHIVVQQDHPFQYELPENPWHTRLRDILSNDIWDKEKSKINPFIDGMEDYLTKKEYQKII